MKTTFPRVNFIHEWKRFLYGLGIFVNICKWKCILMCDCIFVDKGLAEWQCLLYQACLERNQILLVFQRKILREHVINWHKIYIYISFIYRGVSYSHKFQIEQWNGSFEFAMKLVVRSTLKYLSILQIVIILCFVEKHHVDGQSNPNDRRYWSYYQRDGHNRSPPDSGPSQPQVNFLRG